MTTALLRATHEEASQQEEPYIRAALAQFHLEAADVALVLSHIHEDRFIAAAVARILANYANNGMYHAQWLARYTKLIRTTVQVGGQGVAQTVGISFNLTNPRVRDVIKRRAGDLVTNVTDTTKASIRAAVAQGRAEKLGVRKIAKLIEKTTFGEITKTRAQTIARTEVVGALNAGEYEAALASDGALRSKTWLTEADERVRPGTDTAPPSVPNHRVLQDVTVALTARFPNGLLYPGEAGGPAGEVINCRCTAIYSHEEAP